MRMVGASNWYIRIPFMLEGMLIGLIGSIIPIIVLVYGYGMVYDYANGALMSAMLALNHQCHLSAISH
ncbi:MAG: FtsX-like permease family protein [Thomasclavelia ramosa]